jgi:hypothetical protein
VSVALFDLGQRLRAATLARPIARSTFAPVLPPVSPVAVTLSGTGDGTLLKATDGTRVTVGTGAGALSALAELGVSVGPEYRTLAIADRDTLSRLVELARSTDSASTSAASAAVVGWWSQRADHPGSGAVLKRHGSGWPGEMLPRSASSVQPCCSASTCSHWTVRI